MSECQTCDVFSRAKCPVPSVCPECGQAWIAVTICLGCSKDYNQCDCPAGSAKVNRKVANVNSL